jgi:toxin ParE1/3/4
MSEISRKIVLRPRVADDLERQVEYLDQEASPEVGNRYLAAINAAFEQLAGMPGIGTRRDFNNVRLNGLRMWPVPGFPKYLIFYRFTEETVEIVRVLHGAQNIEHILEEE